MPHGRRGDESAADFRARVRAALAFCLRHFIYLFFMSLFLSVRVPLAPLFCAIISLLLFVQRADGFFEFVSD